LVKEQYDLHKSHILKDAVRKSVLYIQQYIIDGIHVYQSQGVNISDKHIEIIVKQMTSKFESQIQELPVSLQEKLLI
jgi:hypothetical protein